MVFSLDELEPGQLRRVEVAGIGLVVARTKRGEVCALRDVCPHHQARLSDGRLEHKVVSDVVGEYRLADEMVIRCPHHGFEFAVEDGQCVSDPKRMRVRAYDVVVENGAVFIER